MKKLYTCLDVGEFESTFRGEFRTPAITDEHLGLSMVMDAISQMTRTIEAQDPEASYLQGLYRARDAINVEWSEAIRENSTNQRSLGTQFPASC